MKSPLLAKYYPEVIFLTIITAVTVFTHFGSLYFTPPWYSDEGWTAALIQNLMNGVTQVFSFQYFWIPHAPISYYLAIPFFYFISDPMVALRTYTAMIGVITTIIVYYLGREIKDRNLGFLSAILYSVFYPAILYYHISFIDYNLSALFITASAVMYLRFLKNHKHKLTEVTLIAFLALSFLTHYYSVIFGTAILLSTIIFRRKLSFVVFGDLCLAALPTLILFIGIYLTMGDIFITHFGFNFLRSAQYGSERYLLNMVNYLYSNWWNIASFISIIIIIVKTRGHIRQLYTSFMITILITFQFTYIVTGGSYAVSYTYPMLMISLAYILYHGFQYMMRRSHGILYLQPTRNLDFFRLFRGIGYIILMTFIVLTFSYSTYGTLNESYNGITNPYPSYLNQYPEGMNAIATWVNANTNATDLVIGSPHYLFMLHCRVSDYPYAVAFNGGSFYRPPALLTDIDVVYSGKYTDAKYCIIDPFVTEWFIIQPGSEFISDITTNWSLVQTISGNGYNYTVYLNPTYQKT